MNAKYSIRLPAVLLISFVGIGMTHDVLAQGCTAQDQQTIALYSQKMIEASMQAMLSGNFQLVNQLSQQMQNQISSDCKAMLGQQLGQQMQFPQGNSGYGGGGGGSVLDHGGGTYSVPNGAACGPGGCIPLD